MLLDYQKRDLRDYFKQELKVWYSDWRLEWQSLKSHCEIEANALESHYKANHIENATGKARIAYYRALARICEHKLSTEV